MQTHHIRFPKQCGAIYAMYFIRRARSARVNHHVHPKRPRPLRDRLGNRAKPYEAQCEAVQFDKRFFPITKIRACGPVALGHASGM